MGKLTHAASENSSSVPGANGLYSFSSRLATSEVRNNTTYGVIKLTLRNQGYDWQFVPINGATLQDAGSGSCLN